jgi:hypothetical protein
MLFSITWTPPCSIYHPGDFVLTRHQGFICGNLLEFACLDSLDTPVNLDVSTSGSNFPA